MAKDSELYRRIAKKFHNRCLICFRTFEVIHHIEPKSSRPKDFDDEDNLAPLCNSCHEKIHADGASKWVRPLKVLREVRLEYLESKRYFSIGNIRLTLPTKEAKQPTRRKKKA